MAVIDTLNILLGNGQNYTFTLPATSRPFSTDHLIGIFMVSLTEVEVITGVFGQPKRGDLYQGRQYKALIYIAVQFFKRWGIAV